MHHLAGVNMVSVPKRKEKEIDWSTTLTAEILLFNLLGEILYTYPDARWVPLMTDKELFLEAPFASGQPDTEAGLELLTLWAEKSEDLMPAESLKLVQNDYSRLFTGIGQVLAPPWESVYLSRERLLFQEQTLQVRSCYQRFGFETPNLGREPDDHIGLEIAFLAHLAGMGLVALRENDQRTFEVVLQAQKQFLLDHIVKWVFDWCALVQKHSQTDFYQGVALLTRGAVLESRDQILVDLPTGVAV